MASPKILKILRIINSFNPGKVRYMAGPEIFLRSIDFY